MGADPPPRPVPARREPVRKERGGSEAEGPTGGSGAPTPASANGRASPRGRQGAAQAGGCRTTAWRLRLPGVPRLPVRGEFGEEENNPAPSAGLCRSSAGCGREPDRAKSGLFLRVNVRSGDGAAAVRATRCQHAWPGEGRGFLPSSSSAVRCKKDGEEALSRIGLLVTLPRLSCTYWKGPGE